MCRMLQYVPIIFPIYCSDICSDEEFVDIEASSRRDLRLEGSKLHDLHDLHGSEACEASEAFCAAGKVSHFSRFSRK